MYLVSVCKRVFSVGFGPGLDSSRKLQGRMTGFPKKWGPGPPEMLDKVDTICTVFFNGYTSLKNYNLLQFSHIINQFQTTTLSKE